MTSPYEEILNDTLGDYRRKRAQLLEMQQELSAVTGAATAPRQVVSVTVGRYGEVTDLKFPTSAYKRLTPAELATVIKSTIDDARSQAMQRSAELLAPMLPEGLSASALVSGNADLSSMLPEEPRLMTSLSDTGVSRP
jgi:DNA-binding protein YbaB